MGRAAITKTHPSKAGGGFSAKGMPGLGHDPKTTLGTAARPVNKAKRKLKRSMGKRADGGRR